MAKESTEKKLFNSKKYNTPPQIDYQKGSYIKQKMEDFYETSNYINQSFWTEASWDNRFEAGDQRAYFEIHRDIPAAYRKTFNFNRIRRIINMISGYQRRNRKSTIVVPVENGDQVTADQYSKIIAHINRKQGVFETISDAFRSSLISGISLLQPWIDFREDPVSGTIKVDYASYDSFIIDPFFKKKDLSDCNAIWKRSYLTKGQLLSLFPEKKKLINEITPGANDFKFQYMPQNSTMNKSNLISYDEFYYLDSRKQTVIIDSQTGETMEWSRYSDFSDEEFSEMLRFYPNLVVSKQSIPTVKMAALVDGTLIYDGANPLGIDEYPFIPVLAYFNPSLSDYSDRIQGVVRELRDPQYLYNRRKVIEDDILSSQVNSGWVYKEDALVDPDDVFTSGQGKGIALKATAQMTDIQKIMPGQVPESMFRLSETYAREIMEISGVNEELLGSASDDKAGILSMLRQGAGLTTLQTLFDNLDFAQKRLGSVMLKAIQANYTPSKVQRIIEQEPSPQFYNKAFGIYDAAIEEGFNTTTQKQTEFAQLLNLRELGIPIPDETIINAATIQNKTELIKTMEEINAQAQQAELENAKIEQEYRRAQTNLANAKVESDLSLAKERDSRVYSNIGLMQERAFQSEKDRTDALLNIVKTLQEIDDVDLNQLMKLIQLSKIVGNKSDNATKKSAVLGTAIVSGATKDIPEAPERDVDPDNINNI